MARSAALPIAGKRLADAVGLAGIVVLVASVLGAIVLGSDAERAVLGVAVGVSGVVVALGLFVATAVLRMLGATLHNSREALRRLDEIEELVDELFPPAESR